MQGHNHTFFFELAQSISNPGTPIVLKSEVGSVTTYDLTNPIFTVVDLDEETMLPINIHVDINKANSEG